MMDSLRKSFKSHGSYKRSSPPSSRKASIDHDHDHQEEQPILFDHHRDHAEVVVNVDDAVPTAGGTNYSNGNSKNNKVWRESSYEFWKEDSDGGGGGGGRGSEFSFPKQQHLKSVVEIGEDPPSRLISSFLHRQRAAGGEMALDMDLEMDELRRCPPATATTATSTSASKELRVSFQDPSANSHSESHSSSDEDESSSTTKRHVRGSARIPDAAAAARDGGGAEVLLCTSNASFRHSSTLLRAKTRSRLMDPPTLAGAAAVTMEDDKRSGRIPRSGQLKSGQLKSGQLKSGLLKSLRDDEDDDDPFFEEDVPEDFKRSNFFSPLTILQWLSLILILAALACSLSIPSWKRQTLWNLHLWKWEVMVLVLICGRLVSGWGIRIAVFFIERNFLLRKRVLYFVYGLRKAVQNCLWLGLVLLAWHYLFDKKVERETRSTTLPYVTKVLFCLLVATLFRLLKTLLVKVLASSFHVSTYFDRIQESLFNQYVIETLSGPPLVELQQTADEEDRMLAEVQKLQNAGATIPNELRAAALPSRSGRVIGSGGLSGSGHGGIQRNSQVGKSVRFSGLVSKRDYSKQQEEAGITIDHLHKLNQKNVSAWNMKRLMKIVRHGTLSTLDEQIPHAGAEDESAMQIRSEQEAKVAARKIFNNVSKPRAKYIYLVDLLRFMREDEALKTLSLFEGAQEMGRVSRRSLKNWVVSAFRERRALSLTLNDTKTAVNKLHQMANIVVGVIVFGLWLLILGIATTHFFVYLSSQVLLAAFMFGNTLKTTFEAIVFLFVMHPFDVGDRCEIDGVQMFVEEMNIMTTVFLRFDNMKVIYPNSVLSTKPIGNVYRSPDMGDSIEFCVHISTPVEKLAVMKERIKAFIESKKEHWHPGPTVLLKDVENFHKLQVAVWLQHRINFQDMGQRWTRRELVVQEMIKVLRELDIEYRMLPVDVNVRDLPALSSSRLPSTWTTCS